jgi:hypothetical protein
MSKDPAFLFYSSDFLTGTMLMSDVQVGRYIRLLCLQHQKGSLSEEDMIKICLSYDKDIWDKFVQDKNGKFCNERLFEESVKRRAYSDSRRKNREKKDHMLNICESYDKHMENENENENRNEDRNEIVLKKDPKKKTFIKPLITEIAYYIQQHSYNVDPDSFFDYYESIGWSVGRNKKPMKDWQACIRTWHKSNQEKDGKKQLIQKFGKQAVDSMDAFKAFNEGMEKENVKLQVIQSGNGQVKQLFQESG